MTAFDGARDHGMPEPRGALWPRLHPVLDRVMEFAAGLGLAGLIIALWGNGL